MVDIASVFLLISAIFVAAVLYSSVGHGGASGYLAVMALAGLAPIDMKPAALTMNIFVTVLVFSRLYRAGHFDIKLFLPFALASIPMAFAGGMLMLETNLFKIVVGFALLIAAIKMLVHQESKRDSATPNWWIAAPVGAVLGFMSGLTGVGGGIYLSPILLLMGWTSMRGSAAIASAFILLNSVAGLAGFVAIGGKWPEGLAYFVIAAVFGGLIGSELAARSLSMHRLRALLGLVLVIAGTKMIYTA